LEAGYGKPDLQERSFVLPTKSFTGSIVVSTLLKIFAIIIGGSGLTFMVLLAVDPTTTGVDVNTEIGLKIVAMLGTFVVSGVLSSLIAAAAYGLDIARDTNSRVALSAQIAAGSVQMVQPMYAPAPTYSPTPSYAPAPIYAPPAQGATYNPGYGQPQAPQPGQPLQ
jgi:hypothetical protein